MLLDEFPRRCARQDGAGHRAAIGTLDLHANPHFLEAHSVQGVGLLAPRVVTWRVEREQRRDLLEPTEAHFLQSCLQPLLRVVAQLGLDHARDALGGLAVRVLPVFLADVLRERVEEDVDLREVQRQADGTR